MSILSSSNDIMPAGAIRRLVEGECDRIVAAAVVAAAVSKAIITNPVILRCFVMKTSVPQNPTGVGHGNCAKVQPRHGKLSSASQSSAASQKSFVIIRLDRAMRLSQIQVLGRAPPRLDRRQWRRVTGRVASTWEEGHTVFANPPLG